MSSSPTSSSSTEASGSTPGAPRRLLDDLVERFGAVRLRVGLEVGTTTMRIRSLLGLAEGSLVVLDRRAGEDFIVRIHGERFGAAELLALEGKPAMRVTEIVDAG